MNKKIIAIVLVILMVMCNSMVALGEDIVTGSSTDGGSTWTYGKGSGSDGTITSNSKDVKANVSITAADTYSVDIIWGALTYTASVNGTWNAENGYYDITDSTTTWNPTSEDANAIKIINRSNVAINATIGQSGIDSDFISNYAPSGEYGFNVGAGVGYALSMEILAPSVGQRNPTWTKEVNIVANITKAPQKSVSDLKVGTMMVKLDKVSE